jgi:hypothetical protein
MDTTDTVNVTRAGEGEHWLFGADVTTIKASGRHTSGDLLVLEITPHAGVALSHGGYPLRRRTRPHLRTIIPS